MKRITYEQAFSDHEYLWKTYGAASDMTGGYVDQEDLARLLRRPTKNTARACLEDQIQYWFQVGFDGGYGGRDASRGETYEAMVRAYHDDEYVREIAERYGIYEP